jgi:hypothetical protein
VGWAAHISKRGILLGMLVQHTERDSHDSCRCIIAARASSSTQAASAWRRGGAEQHGKRCTRARRKGKRGCSAGGRGRSSISVVAAAQKKRALPQFTADVEGSKAIINSMRATHERGVSHQPVGRAWEMKTAQQQYSEERGASRAQQHGWRRDVEMHRIRLTQKTALISG